MVKIHCEDKQLQYFLLIIQTMPAFLLILHSNEKWSV